MNKLIRKLVQPVTSRQATRSAAIPVPADRRLVKTARPPIWRRGTLVLVA